MNQFHRMLVAPALAGVMLTAAATPLLAQVTEQNAPASKQPTQEQDGAEARAKLNAVQAQAAMAQVTGNTTAEANYQRQLQAVADAKAKIASDAAAAEAAYQAEKTRRDAEYQAAMDQWQADVAACNAGEVARCALPAIPAA